MTGVSGDGPSRNRFAGILFSEGFRVFFLAAGLFAAAAIPFWTVAFVNGWSVEGVATIRLWHAHEMYFGYAVAALAGFLLTAMPSWTATSGLGYPGLALLFGLWVLGRTVMAVSVAFGLPKIGVLDILFPIALGVYATAVVWRAGNRRNLVLCGLVLILVAADLAFHLSLLDVFPISTHAALNAALNVFVFLIALIGGRVVPAFTRNALALTGRGRPMRTFRWLDATALVSTACILPVDLLMPETHGAAAVTLVAAVANTLRFLTWQTERTLGSPILWVLHLGYLWLIAGLYMKGLAAALPGLAGLVWVHALSVGAIGTMTLAIMTRAALGHTGRPLQVAPPIVIAYVLVTIASLARIVAPELPGDWYMPAIAAAGTAWTLAFVLFLYVYLPIFASPRVLVANQGQ